MTTREIKLLQEDWITHHDSPLPRRVGWWRALPGWVHEWLFWWERRRRPTFGIDMANQFALEGKTCLLLDKSPYRWVRVAASTFGKSAENCSHDPEMHAAALARDLHYTYYPRRLPLQAALLARDATVQSVANAFGLSTMFVEAYADLFFNVLGLKKNSVYREFAVEAALSRPGMMYMPDKVHPDDAALLHTGLEGNLADVMQLVKRQGRVLDVVN